MSVKSLSLYHYQSCPFCAMSRNAINQLNIDVELRDIQLDKSNFIDLMTFGGKMQVPCLLIENSENEFEWLYESNDIINYIVEYSNLPQQVA